jgi:hypothetical protein
MNSDPVGFGKRSGRIAGKRVNSDKRWAIRRAVNAPGLIVSDTSTSSVRCMVSDISSTGALIEVGAASSSASSLPDKFNLQLIYDRSQVRCEVVWRNGTMAGVRFLSMIEAMPKVVRRAKPTQAQQKKSLLSWALKR